MLSDHDPVPTLAVAGLQGARDFYESVLGFVPGPENPEGVFYAAGSGRFLVYPSSFAGSNKATAMSFQIPAASFEAEVSALRGRVEFQTFELEGISWADGVATFGADQSRAVWFEDPDGNILNLESATPT